MHSEVWTEASAQRYDSDLGPMGSDEVVGPTVGFLESFAPGGRALEFAIGTGRIALPLVERGVVVAGIELSQPMLDKLRSKAGGADIAAVHGDMATTRLDDEFDLVYLVFNTITNLLTQDAQVACFENAAAHLRPGGAFVVETFVPQIQRLPMGERLVPFEVTERHVGIDEYDVATQMLTSHHVTTRPDGTSRSSPRFRYAWPAELDLMARIAGMQLFERWADWTRAPFTSTSTSHVSVWKTPS